MPTGKWKLILSANQACLTMHKGLEGFKWPGNHYWPLSDGKIRKDAAFVFRLPWGLNSPLEFRVFGSQKFWADLLGSQSIENSFLL